MLGGITYMSHMNLGVSDFEGGQDAHKHIFYGISQFLTFMWLMQLFFF